MQAGWIRDGTWPRGAVAPEPDDVLESAQEPEYIYSSMMANAPPEFTESVPSPQTTEALASFPPSMTPTDASMGEGGQGDG